MKISVYELIFICSSLLMMVIVTYLFITDVKFRNWLMASWEEKIGRASGKSLTAFSMSGLICAVVVVAVKYSEKHIIPEWMFFGLLAFVGGLYGIKVASKYVSPDTVKTELPTQSEELKSTDNKNQNKPYIEEPIV